MAKKPQVKCKICGNKFYREEEDFVQVGRYYCHKKCYNESDEQILEEIHKYCKEKYGNLYSKQRINKQIKELQEEGKTLNGINGALRYWYDIRGGDVSKSCGSIRIVSYIYGEYLDWVIQRNKIKEKEEQLECVEELNNPDTKIFIYNPEPIAKPKRMHFFDIR